MLSGCVTLTAIQGNCQSCGRIQGNSEVPQLRKVVAAHKVFRGGRRCTEASFIALPKRQQQFRKERLGSDFTLVTELLLGSRALGNWYERHNKGAALSLSPCSPPADCQATDATGKLVPLEVQPLRSSSFWWFSVIEGQGAFGRSGLQDVATFASLGRRGPEQFRSITLSRRKNTKNGEERKKGFQSWLLDIN